ncbi:TrmH family RNA methyltransferase [Microlunatus soli]|uniref:RNA methyltransferase, TrmH family n=1 Tax=Microlunatus soli TaxID=630515 RepID=A0A1H1XWP7_9ACTN|nr:RNA methyltransferase [Microlunatus soli]SDT13708.1 RNA methyltransferase, TrmH family [Microlunatus soli]
MSNHEPTALPPAGLPPASQGQLRSARRLLRRKERLARGRFLAEGPQAVREALAAGAAELILCTDRAAGRHPDLVDGRIDPSAPGVGVSEADLGSLTDSSTPQGIIAVCRTVDVDLVDAVPAEARLIVCCSEIRDPGNAGTVIRCADAAGADAVILSRASVDLYNPKTVRASTGSIFHLPIVVDVDLEQVLQQCRTAGMQILAAAGGGDADLDQLVRAGELAAPTVWLMGNEAHGLDQDHLALADRAVAVPIYGRAESLNLSTAAAVCLYASAFAQRT